MASSILIADKLPELVRTQAEAIKNIKIDKVTVWENGGGKDGKTSTSNFISGMYKSVPPLQEMFNMAGMDLPEYLKGESGFKLKEEEFGKESGIGGSNFLSVNEIAAQNEYNNAVSEIITINPFYKNRINFFVQNEVAQ